MWLKLGKFGFEVKLFKLVEYFLLDKMLQSALDWEYFIKSYDFVTNAVFVPEMLK